MKYELVRYKKLEVNLNKNLPVLKVDIPTLIGETPSGRNMNALVDYKMQEQTAQMGINVDVFV